MSQTTTAADIQSRLQTINDEIAKAAGYAMLSETPTPTLIAVSKLQDDSTIEAALEAGLRTFGENRVQEAESRWQDRRSQYDDLTLHLIGGLQTNKADDAVKLFDVIESVDRIKLADKIKQASDKLGKKPAVYIQVNTGGEEQKAGVSLDELEALIAHVRAIDLDLQGLMCIPPKDDDASLHFALLKKLAKQHGLSKLSMGMSADYALASSMGATSIRVGSALLGERPKKAD